MPDHSSPLLFLSATPHQMVTRKDGINTLSPMLLMVNASGSLQSLPGSSPATSAICSIVSTRALSRKDSSISSVETWTPTNKPTIRSWWKIFLLLSALLRNSKLSLKLYSLVCRPLLSPFLTHVSQRMSLLSMSVLIWESLNLWLRRGKRCVLLALDLLQVPVPHSHHHDSFPLYH
jgi:hypothetical protein